MTSRRSRLSRLFSPGSIAWVGGTIAAMAIRRSRELGYRGEIWPVNPERRSMEGLPCYASVEELPGVPDAAHVAVNRQLTVDIVRRLEGPTKSGFHRVAWDLRYPRADALELVEPPPPLWGQPPRGLMAAPGEYTMENVLHGTGPSAR